MKIILISIGTRGDIEPFISLSAILQENGHKVICCFPEQFRILIEDPNIEFVSLGSEFIDILNNTDEGKKYMGGSLRGIRALQNYIKLCRMQNPSNNKMLRKQYELIGKENPDVIVHNPLVIYPYILGLNNIKKTIVLTPVPNFHYVNGHSHVFFHCNFGVFLNKFSFSIIRLFDALTIYQIIKWWKIPGKNKIRDIKKFLYSVEFIYNISPILYTKPKKWNDNLKVLGFNDRNEDGFWFPDKELIQFLNENKKVLFITFGSLLNPAPEEKTKIFIDILEKNNISAIINTCSGGLVKPKEFFSKTILFVSNINYNWIFPRVYAVVHHGGSGTTQSGIKHGCATLIIPHFLDQFVWNKMISKKRLGPLGISINKISSKNLEPKILELMNNESFKINSIKIGKEMIKENFKQELYYSIIK